MADADYQRLRPACFCGEPTKLRAPGARGRLSSRCEAHIGKPQQLAVACDYTAGYCKGCGAAYGRRGKQATCSARCAELARALARHRAAGRVKACGECGAEFCPMYGNSLAELCAPCGEARALAAKKADKALRRAMSRGANGGERFDPVEVLERDKWRCQLCGRKTPKAKRGSYDDDAPELDHIVPVAAGGKHTRANTQCACRACNSAKGARTLGQLNLALA